MPFKFDMVLTDRYNEVLDRLNPEVPSQKLILDRVDAKTKCAYKQLGCRLYRAILHGQQQRGRSYKFAYVNFIHIQSMLRGQHNTPIEVLQKHLDGKGWEYEDLKDLCEALKINGTHKIIKKFMEDDQASVIMSKNMNEAFIEDFQAIIGDTAGRAKNCRSQGMKAIRIPVDKILSNELFADA